MIFLKELNLQDAEKEYEYIVSVPADENGFVTTSTVLHAKTLRQPFYSR